MIHWQKRNGHIPLSGRDAGCRQDDKMRFLGEFESLERGENVVGCVTAESAFAHGFAEVNDANARDDDVGWAAMEGQRAFDGVDAEDVTLGDGKVCVDGGLRDAALEEEVGEFGWGACDWGKGC